MADTPVPAPPPGLSHHIASVQKARATVQACAQRGAPDVCDYGVVVDLLAAYDALAARLSWVAAQHAECGEA